MATTIEQARSTVLAVLATMPASTQATFNVDIDTDRTVKAKGAQFMQYAGPEQEDTLRAFMTAIKTPTYILPREGVYHVHGDIGGLDCVFLIASEVYARVVGDVRCARCGKPQDAETRQALACTECLAAIMLGKPVLA